jgi:hypothetical protein
VCGQQGEIPSALVKYWKRVAVHLESVTAEEGSASAAAAKKTNHFQVCLHAPFSFGLPCNT